MRSYVVCGMQFGDEGKGSFVDYLANKSNANWIVRYNGGANASHTVITPNGKIHRFCQLGAGMFNDNTKVYMSRNMVLNIDKLILEINRFNITMLKDDRNIYSRIFISPFCYLVTPYHVLISKLRELNSGINRRGVGCTGVSEVRYLEYISRNEKGSCYKKYGHLGIQIFDIDFSLTQEANKKLRKEESDKEISLEDFINGLEKKILALKKYAICFYEEHKDKINKNIPDFMKENLNAEIARLFAEKAETELAKSLMSKFESFINMCKSFVRKSICGKVTDDGLQEVFPCEDEILKYNDVMAKYSFAIEEYLRKYTIIYEGAQGLLLDGKYGIRPNVTQLDTTTNYALKYIGEINKSLLDSGVKFDNVVAKIGIAKAFYTKHGKGTFPTESFELKKFMCEEMQDDSYWNGNVRYGWFDAVLLRYAQRINKVGQLFLSSIDKLDGLDKVYVCNSYEYVGPVDKHFESLFDYYRDDSLNYIITNIKHSSNRLGEYLKRCKPIYVKVPGWNRSIVNDMQGRLSLSGDCKNYVRLISSLIGIPVTMVSFGPSREQRFFVHLK